MKLYDWWQRTKFYLIAAVIAVLFFAALALILSPKTTCFDFHLF